MDPSAHYGRSTIYRLLRPLAVAQLIERVMGVVDFSVDAEAVGLLRFGATAERMLRLSSDDIVMDHPGVDWARQTQHLYRDNLRATAARLIDDDDARPKVIGYDRFQTEIPDPARDDELAALAAILRRCDRRMTENPIFWLRLVGYAYACGKLIREQGVPLGFARPTLDPADLLRKTNDEFISTHVDDYLAAMCRIADEGLSMINSKGCYWCGYCEFEVRVSRIGVANPTWHWRPKWTPTWTPSLPHCTSPPMIS